MTRLLRNRERLPSILPLRTDRFPEHLAYRRTGGLADGRTERWTEKLRP